MQTDDRKAHWEAVYSTKGERDVSWFEDSPQLSLDLIRAANVGSDAAIVDIGGGASRLVDALIDAGQAHVTVLDLSQAALATAKARIGARANVAWVAGDVTTWIPTRSFNLWHDRAAFHFLISEDDQRAYVRVLSRALGPGAVAIIGTFAPDGPEKCSGLPVARYDAEGMQQVLGPAFTLRSHQRHEHVTPWGSVQRFQFSTFEKAA